MRRCRTKKGRFTKCGSGGGKRRGKRSGGSRRKAKCLKRGRRNKCLKRAKR